MVNLSSIREYSRRILPKKMFYREIVPLCGKDHIEIRRQRVTGTACTEEMQMLFACLKKWEYDDLPCSKFKESYMRCVAESEKTAEAHREAAMKGTLGGDDDARFLTSAQLNNVMKRHPQPDLGQHPYRLLKRLPTQSYADDVFNKKKLKGKKS